MIWGNIKNKDPWGFKKTPSGAFFLIPTDAGINNVNVYLIEMT